MSWFTKAAGSLWNHTPVGAGVNAINRERRAGRERNEQKNTFWRANGGDPNQRFNQAIVDEGAGGGWEDALTRSAGSLYNRALPQLREGLQLTREDAIRRGVSTGDLGTSMEGDLVSKWGQNFSDTLGSMAMQGYQTNRDRYLDLLSGRLDRNTAAGNARGQTAAGAGQGIAQLLPLLALL